MRILLVEARFYPNISDMLYEGATQVLDAAGAIYEALEVPGALEIPAAIGMTAGKFDGFVALGCVIRGETYHFEIVANESARGLMALSVNAGLCIGNGILTVENEEQALRRADRALLDKGGDAARACLAMLKIRARLGPA